MSSKPLPPTRMEYQGLCMRSPGLSDWEQIENAYNFSLKDLQVFMDWAHHPVPRDKQVERLMEQHARYFLGVEYELALFNQNGEFLFYSGVYPINRINPKAYEIGFWTSSQHKGKGYATLGTKILIAFLFEYLKADRLELTCNIENESCLKVIEKCGFKYEGELRNFYPEGTEEMHQNGYIKERRVSAFSLIPKDRKDLSWYAPLLSETLVYPLFQEAKPLDSYFLPC